MDAATTAGKTKMQQTCPHCGMMHATTCPRIKAIEYFPDGTVKHIEFHGATPLPISLFETVFGR